MSDELREQPDSANAEEQTQKQSLGRWLDEPDEVRVAKEITGEWNKQNYAAERWARRAKRNRYWRMGYRDVVYTEDEDRSEVRVYLSKGATPLGAPVNKVDRIVRTTVAMFAADPPAPDCEPATDQDEDLQAAETTTRVLKVEGSAQAANDLAMMQYAVDRSSTWSSDFVYQCVDPQGGGSRPKPMQREAGEQIEQGYQRPFDESQPEQDLFTQNPAEAEEQHFSRIVVHHLHPPHVRLVPEFSSSLKQADLVIITLPMQLGTLREQCPEIDAISDADLKSAAGWRPDKWELGLDPYQRKLEDRSEVKGKRPEDDTVLWPLIVYGKKSYGYPKGAALYVIGGKHVPYRKPWTAQTPSNATGEMKEEVLRFPVSQCRQLIDTNSGDPMGNCIVSFLGPIDEAAQSMLVAQLDWNYRAAHPNVFAPIGSNIATGQLGVRDDSVIEYNPGVGSPVVYEDVPGLPNSIPETLQVLWEEEDKEGVQDGPSRGETDSSVTSGAQAQTLIAQGQQRNASLRASVAEFIEDVWTARVQLMRAFFSGPQMMKYLGEDGNYKLTDWMATDLGSTKDVKIAKGSFTMMTPQQKSAFAAEQRAAGLIGEDDYLRTVTQNVSAITGIQDDPNRQRVKRQIAEWLEGPSPELVAEQKAAEQQMQQQQAQMAKLAAMAAQQGVALPPPELPPSPMIQAVAQIFVPLPVDDEQLAAKVRHAELSRVMASTKYEKMPRPWQDGFVMEYQRAKLAAGVVTIPEQQAAMAQQQQQAMQQEEKKGENEKAEKVADSERGHMQNMERDEQKAAQRPMAIA